MREKKEYMIFTFRTTTEAMAMEAKCMEQKLPGRLIPVPREITAGCGLAWRIPLAEYEIFEEQLHQLGMSFENCVKIKML